MRRAASLAALLALACNGNDGPSAPRPVPTAIPACVNLSGTWQGTFGTSCGSAQTGVGVVSQNGCSATLVSLAIAVQGTISGNSITFTATDVRCPGTVFNGTATIHSQASITGSYATTMQTSCCPNGSFTLIR